MLDAVFIVVITPLGLIGALWVLVSGARRLLGVRVGLLRGGLAALTGWAAAGTAARLIARPDPAQPAGALGFITLSLGIGLLVAMLCLVACELLWPPGARPVTSGRALRRRVARIRRYLRICAIAARHGVWSGLRAGHGSARLARSLRLALQEAGGTYVKLGQLLSTRRDLLPAAFAAELAHLCSDVAPAPWEQVRALLVEELGAPPEQVFAEFDAVPFSAASIAQAHHAVLRDGTEVVVKVQRPGLRPLVECDLDIVCRLAAVAETRSAAARALGAVDLADGFAEALREELDFRIEAANLAAVRAEHTGPVLLPAVHEELSGERVLVLQRLDGVPLGGEARPDARPALARALLECVLRQVMLHGVFHADPHPGNVLLMHDGRLGLLDFGSVGRLDAALRSGLRRLLTAIDRADAAGLRAALLDLVGGRQTVDEHKLEQALSRFMTRHLGGGHAPTVAMFVELLRLVSAYCLAAPPALAAVFRSLATLEGTLGRLAPGFDLVAEARAMSGRAVVTQLDPVAAGRSAGEELRALLPVLRELPHRAERIAGAIEQGRLSVQVKLFGDEQGRRFVTGLVHQVIQTVLVATTGIMAVLLLGTTGGPMVTASTSLFEVIAYHLLVVSGALGLRVLAGVLRTQRRPGEHRP